MPVAAHPARELVKVKVLVTICLCMRVLAEEAGLDQGDGLSVARPGWAAFSFGGSVLWVLQHSYFIFPWKQPLVLEALGDFGAGVLRKPVDF